MQYNLETINPRYNLGSHKWNEMQNNPLVNEKVIPFSVADMELNMAPEIAEGLKKFIDTNILGYAGSNEAYQEAVISWLNKHHNWQIEKSWFIETHSVVNAFFTAVKAFTKKGDGVILFTPVYYPMYKAIQINERKIIEVPLINTGTTYDINWQDFEAKAKSSEAKLLILCSPHNPCSRIWTKSELERINRICLENNIFVVSDEIHSDLIMPGFNHISFGIISEGARQNSMVCMAPSKTFNLAGMQISNIIIPNSKYRKLFQAEQITDADFACPILAYEACRLAYTHGEAWLAEVIALVYKNAQIVIDFMQKYFPQIKITQLQATYLLWMDFRALNLDYKQLEQTNRQKAALYFDEGYIFGSAGAGFERWNLACPTKYINWALERFYQAYKQFAAK